MGCTDCWHRAGEVDARERPATPLFPRFTALAYSQHARLAARVATRIRAPLQAIYVPADDLTDPAPATTFAHLDATTVLSRGIAGEHPAALIAVVYVPSPAPVLHAPKVGRSSPRFAQLFEKCSCPKAWLSDASS